MRLRWIALEPIHQTGLCSAKRKPVAPGLLQCDKELPTAVHRPFVQFIFALELDLERVLAAHRMVGAALTPDGDIRLRSVSVAEVQYSEVLEYFLDDGLVYQFDPVGVGCL